MSGMVHGSVKNSKISRPSGTIMVLDIYRRGPSSEVQCKVSLVLRSMLRSALRAARLGLPQLQWQCQQRGVQRQLLVVHTRWLRQRVEPQLQFRRSEHEQQQAMQRQLRHCSSRTMLKYLRCRSVFGRLLDDCVRPGWLNVRYCLASMNSFYGYLGHFKAGRLMWLLSGCPFPNSDVTLT